MELFIHERDEVSYVALGGRFDVTGVEEVEQPFTEATTGRGLPTIVEMSGITFMSSLGIGFLYANTKELKKAGCKLVLLNPKGMVDTVLRSSKMDRVMPIAYELEEALQLLGFERASFATDVPKVDAPPQPETVEAAPNAAAELKLSIKNETSELTDLYAQVENFLEAHSTSQRSRYVVNLALEELVVNVIRYAYVDFDEHRIDIDLGIVNEQFILVIEDDGTPFDPLEALSPSLNPELDQEGDEDLDFEVGGLGLQLVMDLVDVMNYARVEEKNRVEVRVQFRNEGAAPFASG
ncbi:MAG: anti-sigma factor antagonist [Planctomycetes bacterium]|nr:anti-sigma factor antagonist [Planctomycetota bacterium]